MGDHSATTNSLISLVAGGTAGGTESLVTYPFEFAKTRAQLRRSDGKPAPRNPFLVIGQVYRKEGVRALYKGCSSMVIGTIAKDAIRFVSFDAIKEAFKDPETGYLSPARNVLAGMSAGIVSSTLAVTPSERIKTALIDDAQGSRRFNSTLHALQTLVKENGPKAIYRGYVSTTLKQMGTTTVRLGSYNLIKQFEEARDIEQTTAVNFANGAFAGTITVYTTQPIDTVKTRAQSARGEGTLEALNGVWKDGGVKAFWRGSTMRLGRLMVSGGILFTTYEQISSLLSTLLHPDHEWAT